MTSLRDIFDVDALSRSIGEGWVTHRTHPTATLAILNYTDKATYTNHWDDITLNCRGLIYDENTLEVVARGMPKFFNYGQPGAPEFSIEDEVYLADKMDGSLAIFYRHPSGQWRIATRGRFVSEQALHANTLLDSKDEDERQVLYGWLDLHANEGNTVVGEIIYPENRIVVDYGDLDTILTLGTVDNVTGRFTPVPNTPVSTFGEVMALPPRENAEGWVLTRVDDGAMAKVKYPEYLALHRIVTGLSARTLWQYHVEGVDVDQYIASLPDEFQEWAKGVMDNLEFEVDSLYDHLCFEYDRLLTDVERIYGTEFERGDFAREVTIRYGGDSLKRSAMFLLFDSKDILPVLWKHVKPEATMARPSREGLE